MRCQSISLCCCTVPLVCTDIGILGEGDEDVAGEFAENCARAPHALIGLLDEVHVSKEHKTRETRQRQQQQKTTQRATHKQSRCQT